MAIEASHTQLTQNNCPMTPPAANARRPRRPRTQSAAAHAAGANGNRRRSSELVGSKNASQYRM